MYIQKKENPNEVGHEGRPSLNSHSCYKKAYFLGK